MEHGVIEPATEGLVRHCPDPTCLRLAHQVIRDRATKLPTYAKDHPTRCANGHPYTPGRVSTGHEICHTTGGHETWRCRVTDDCDSRIVWPPYLPACDHSRRD